MRSGAARAPLILAGIVAAVAMWRLALLAQMPCISRDGVLYCEQARALRDDGLKVLRDPRFPQHPLFPLAILGIHEGLRICGLADAPLTWQYAGQSVAFVSGLAVVLLAGWVTRRLFLAAELPQADAAGLWAAGLAGILPLNMWLAVDVMSEPLFLVFFLAAIGLAVRVERTWQAAATGALAGLAFLVRPEGAVAAVAAGVTIIAGTRSWAWPSQPSRPPTPPRLRQIPALVALAGAFLLIAGPYWLAAGKLSSKLDKQTIEDFRPARNSSNLQFAALLREDVAWYEALPRTAFELLRAGRVTVVMAAAIGVWLVRRRLLQPPLLVLTTALGVHLALCALLLVRAGYLDPRHVLPSLMCLVPAAGGLMAVFVDGLRRRRDWVQRGDGVLAVIVLLAPLMLYSMRIPNGSDRPIREVADWMGANLPERGGRLLLGGGSERRIAFYAGLRWQPWPENEASREARYERLRGYLTGFPADYLAIRTGPGREVADNDELLNRLRAEPALAGKLRILHEARGADGTVVHLLSFRTQGDNAPH